MSQFYIQHSMRAIKANVDKLGNTENSSIFFQVMSELERHIRSLGEPFLSKKQELIARTIVC